jgi:hypothetical protein
LLHWFSIWNEILWYKTLKLDLVRFKDEIQQVYGSTKKEKTSDLDLPAGGNFKKQLKEYCGIRGKTGKKSIKMLGSRKKNKEKLLHCFKSLEEREKTLLQQIQQQTRINIRAPVAIN